jgi:YD repeat-containing protein
MSLPTGIATVVVSGTLLTPDGNGASGSIQFIPNNGVLYAGVDVDMMASAVVVNLGPGGTFTVALPATDDVAGNPLNWSWKVNERIKGGRQFNIALPKNPTTVDYSSLVPVPATDGTAVVVGPMGATGPTGATGATGAASTVPGPTGATGPAMTDATLATAVQTGATKTALSSTYLTVLTPVETIAYNTDGTVSSQTIGGVATTYTYNGDGTVATETRAGVTRTYTYTGANLTAVA